MKIKLWMGAIGLTLCLLVQPVAAGQYEDGTAAYHRKDYLTAIRLWKPLAEQGDAKAQYNLGVIDAKGRGVPQNYAKAVKWFYKAAEQGYAKAQNNLGIMYNKGWGVKKNYVQAQMWFHLAATRGDANAIKSLDRLRILMTPAQTSKAQKLANEWVTAHPKS